jgi:prophage regulatory protein
MKHNAKIPGSKDQPAAAEVSDIRVIRHAQICQKLGLSSAKLFDMVAKGIFPEPFTLVPGGRAVGWLEHEVDHWIIQRRESAKRGTVPKHGAPVSAIEELKILNRPRATPLQKQEA